MQNKSKLYVIIMKTTNTVSTNMNWPIDIDILTESSFASHLLIHCKMTFNTLVQIIT